MRDQLRFNVCGLESSFAFDYDLPDLERLPGAKPLSELRNFLTFGIGEDQTFPRLGLGQMG